MMRCADIEADLVAHAQLELDALREARVDAHLLHCARCREASSELGEALRAGRAWVPRASDDEVARLRASLEGLVPAPRARRGRAMAGHAAIAAAAALVVVLGAAALREPAVTVVALEPVAPARGHEPPVVSVSRAMTVEEQEQPVARERVRRSRWARELRAVASEAWDGRVTSAPHEIEVAASRGFAVMALDASARPLRLRTDDLHIEVGPGAARLFVEAWPGRPTRVGVLAGRVEVLEGQRRTLLEAGQVRDGTGGVPALSRRYHGDPYLLEPTARAARTATRPAASPALDVLAVVGEAEDLARAGRARAAEALLRSGAARSEDARARALLRFEVGRLVARDPMRRSEALELLGAVAAEGHGEPSVQAALLRCELELDHDRCAARRCLEALVPELPEARRVLERSRLSREPCGS